MNIDRRALLRASLALPATAALRTAGAAQPAPAADAAADADWAALRQRPLSIGMLLFERMDQIDFTGPFSVLSRLPQSTLHVLAPTRDAVRDHKGLVLIPQMAIDEAPALDVLVVTGGPGQEALMDHAPLLQMIARQAAAGGVVFSVCTGALLCGAAGVLSNRRATTHWAAAELLPYFGAIRVDQRVVVDGRLVTAAGITAGIDGALVLASLLRSAAVAQEIQLDIQYAPEPPYQAGMPQSAPDAVREAVTQRFSTLTAQRRQTAMAWAARQP